MAAGTSVLRFPLSPRGDESDHAAAHRHVDFDFVLEPAQPSHFVQFYEHEDALYRMVGHFLGAGLRAGDRMLVIATAEHRAAFLRTLEETASPSLPPGQITWLDAHETLSAFMVDGRPDGERFRRVLADAIGRAKGSARTANLRAYGEMVDLLWRSGNCEGAIRLEELWNEAGRDHKFALFCAYTMGHFYKESEGAKLYRVCKTHTHVIPAESVTRERALEKEIAHRKELEEVLRSALSKRREAEEELRGSLRREQEARQQAERMVEFQDLFVGILGHDLRNPLNTILNTARIMRTRRDLEPEETKRLDRVIASGIRMERMIAQILDVTRLRLAGGIPVKREWQDVSAIVERIVAEVQGAHASRGIRFSTQGHCWAVVDGDRFEQVVANLLGNAVTHGTGAAVTISLSGSATAVRLCVHNEGPAIDPKFMPFLFDPFSRPEKLPGPSEGLGLGLYIADRIVKAHDGIIDAVSSPENGTTFEVTIPKRPRGTPG
jgi:signal transduction histidine kinase